MDIYDAIFYRKTTKKYSNINVKEGLIEEIKYICNNIDYLNKNLNIKAHVVERGHLINFLMGRKCSIKAPHYIVITSNKGDDYLQNIGYAMESVVLKLTSLGIATCWLECRLKREDILEFIELEEANDYEEDEENVDQNLEEPVSIIAFGYPERNERLFKSIEEDSKIDRKRIKHIARKLDKKWIKVLNAVRLSPSIKNCQPWMFYNKQDELYIYEERQKKVIENMSKISMGIALRHFDIACDKYGIDVSYEKTKAKKKMGKDYFMTVTLK
ncbi:nitroreductase family protein [Clostridium sp. CCUG 7971]|uniref:nitroreductase family protein n=1 Tax=Clostridium sp. CCUG 7971 TaxID=2811414 RepID=UPI001ABB1644|nr:nitroreductase family protein [Clostridium sp. CCUG 7971]MBO3445167.1 nitroreductase family protein [Clostridium sp. CCUG 7971]